MQVVNPVGQTCESQNPLADIKNCLLQIYYDMYVVLKLSGQVSLKLLSAFEKIYTNKTNI